MPRSRYEWLKDEQRKEQKREQKSLDSLRKNLAVMGGAPFAGGVGGQYLGNTGAGEDGIVQKDMPTMMVQTPQGARMIHEGENIIQKPSGNVQVQPARQSALMQMEKQGNVPGYAMGGSFRNIKSNGATPYGGAISTAQDFSRRMFGPDTQGQNTATGGATPYGGAISTAQDFSRRMFVPGTQGQDYAAQVAATEVPDYSAQVAATEVPDYSAQVAATEVPDYSAQVAATEVPDDYSAQVAATDTSGADITTGADGQQATEPSGGGKAYENALARLEAIASGQSPYATQIRQQELRRAKGEEQAARGALEQAMAQQDMQGGAAMAERGMLGARAAQQQAGLMGDLRQQEAARVQQAAMQLPSLEMAAQNQEFDQDLQQAQFLMAANDFQGAARVFENLTGNGADMSNMQDLFEETLIDTKLGRFQNLMNNLTSILPYLDENTATSMGALIGQMSMRGLEMFGGDVMDEESWSQLDSFLSGESNTPGENGTTYLKSANTAIEAVSDSDDWLTLQLDHPELFADESPESAMTQGKIAGALIRQNNGNLNDPARDILKEYGLYNEGLDIQSTMDEEEIQTARTNVIDNIQQGNFTEAERIWNDLPDDAKDGQEFEKFVGENLTSLVGTNGNLITTDQARLYNLIGHSGNVGEIGDADIPAQLQAVDPPDWSDMLKWVNPSGAGNAHWELKESLVTWADQNIGKIVEHPHRPGQHFVLTGYRQTGPENEDERGYLIFYDIEGGQMVTFATDSGGKTVVGNLPKHGENVVNY